MTKAVLTDDERWRQIFKRFNRFMLLIWRLGLGRWLNSWPSVGGRIMVIINRGRRSGRWRRTPVNYAPIDDALCCTSGFGSRSDWYRNILADPQVEVWLPGGRWQGIAEDISDHPDRLALMRQVLIASGFAARLAGINPRSISDEKLASETGSYRLIRIRRTASLSGLGGPGDLVWIWPLAILILIMLFRCG